MKEKILIYLKSSKKILLFGFGFALIFWILESYLHTFVFNKGNFINRLFTSDLHEIWMRLFIVFILLIFSIYVQFIVNKLSHSQQETKLAYNKLNQIFNTVVDGMRVIDRDFNMLLMNEAFSFLSGIRKDEAVGKKCYEVFRGQSCHTSRCPLSRILSGEEGIKCDVEKVRKNGTIVPCILTAVPFLGLDGEIIGIVEVFKDITGREHAKQAMEESEKKYRELINLLPQTVFEVDLDCKFTTINQFGFDSTGYTQEEVDKGLSALDIFVPNDRKRVKRNIIKALAGEKIEGNEFTVIRKDGTSFPTIIFFSPIIYEDKPMGLRGIVVDITERKELEKVWEKIANEWNSTFDSISLQVALVDTEKRILRCNKAMEIFIGKSFSDIMGHRICDFVHYNDESFGTDECPFNIKKEFRYRQSRIFFQEDNWISVILDPLFDNSGNVIGAVHIMDDITEQIKAEKKLISATEQLHALTSHLLNVREEERIRIARELHDELSPILTVLKMGVIKIAERLSKYEKRENFEDLIEKADSMKNILTYSVKMIRKIITQLRPGILDTLGLIPAIEWQIEEFQENSGINCNLSSTLEKVTLNSNESTAVFRIFQEALTNILRHADASKVDIALKRENECFIVEVKDNGFGITQADIDGRESFGIMGMQERANLYGWHFNITGIKGKGTTVNLTIPMEGKQHE
jgi:PAS domain S-box-containing protein